MRTSNLWIRLAWSLIAIAPWVAAQDQARPAIARSAEPAAPHGGASSFGCITHQSGNSVSFTDTDFNAAWLPCRWAAHPSAPRRSVYVVNAISNEAQVSRTSTKEGGP